MIKATVIIDNQVPLGAKRPLRAEHGQSLLLETPAGRILFDTGQSDLIIHNLSLLGFRPADLDAVVISHGHYDHAGGLSALLTHARKRLPVYIHPAAFTPRFAENGSRRFIGIPFSQELLVQLGADFQSVEAPLALAENIWLSGPVPRETDFEKTPESFVMSGADGSDCHDCVIDDMSLFIETNRKLTVISGCAHAGIINTIKYGFKITSTDTLHAVIGGTHLGSASEQQQTATLEALFSLDPDIIAASHCTGFAMLHRLAEIFDKRFVPAFVGAQFEL